MSITQTYYLAHKARGKLSREAAQPDHDLRLLVGHANLLDSLMVELADAEREQEQWFNKSVRSASNKKQQQDRRVQWADQVIEEEEYDSDSSDDSDSEDEDIEMAFVPEPTKITYSTVIEDDAVEDDDDEEDYAQLSLVRTHSHSASPPELVAHDSEEDSSEDESMPLSPPQPTIATFSEKEIDEDAEIAHQGQHFYEDAHYIPARNPARLVSAVSVY